MLYNGPLLVLFLHDLLVGFVDLCVEVVFDFDVELLDLSFQHFVLLFQVVVAGGHVGQFVLTVDQFLQHGLEHASFFFHLILESLEFIVFLLECVELVP